MCKFATPELKRVAPAMKSADSFQRKDADKFFDMPGKNCILAKEEAITDSSSRSLV
jgi:hypothetical protein